MRSAGLSTRAHLVLLVVALLVPVLAFAGLLVHRYATAERIRFEHEAMETAGRTAALIDRDLAGLQAALQTLSTSARIPTGEYEAFHHQASEVRGFLGEHIVLRDLSGQQLANTRVPWGAALPRSTLDPDREAIATKRPIVSNVFTGAVAQMPLFAIVVPVLQGDEVTHLLSLSIPTDRLVPLLRESLNAHWTAGAFDRSGIFIARSERHSEFTGRHGPQAFTEGASGTQGIWRGTGLIGAPVLLGYAETLTGWRVFAGAPEEVIEAPLTRALWLLATLGAGLVGAALLMAYAVGAQIAGSIKALAAKAASLGRGETVLPMHGPLREVNEVAQALSAASIGLRERGLERDTAEAAMQASEARFRQLAEALPQLVWIMREDGEAIYWNQRCTTLYGEAWRDLTGRLAAIHPDDRANAAKARADAVAMGRFFQIVVRLRSQKGPYRWHLLSVVPLGGEGAAWVGTATDVDDVRRAEETNARLAAIVTASADAIISFSAEGLIQSWNPAAEALFGYSAEEAIGGPASLLVPPDSPEGPRGAFDRAIAGEIVRGEGVRVAKNGERIDIAVTAAPIRASDGTIAGVKAAMRDIREAKRAEAALRESEEHFRTLAEHVPQLAWMANAEGWIFWYNQRWYDYTGTTPRDMEGWGWQSVHDPEVLPDVMERWQASITSGEPFDMVFPLKGADGVFRPFLTRVQPMRDAEGRMIRWIGTNTDISAERAAEERQQLLINELNHRVKNTLATVQAIAAQTLRSSATDQEARAAFEARILALSKVHNVLTRENWEMVSLADIAGEVLAPHGGEDPTRFQVEGSDVRLHPRMALPLAMALHELATNAIKYGALSNGNGRVSIEWRVDPTPEGRRLRLRWAEEGGPPVSAPARRGFGSRLIERSLASELGGRVSIDYLPSGVVCTVDAPLPADLESGSEAEVQSHRPAAA